LSHEFRGQSRRRRGQQAGWSQASTRRGITLYDQHDREWTTQVSNHTGMPTSAIVPSFQAPWFPDEQYLKVNPDNTSELYIDYESLLRNRNAFLNEYHQAALVVARQKELPTPERGNYHAKIVDAIGPMPKPIEPIVAAMQGNVYILGKTYAESRGLDYRVDKRLERFCAQANDTDRLLEQFDFGSAPGDEERVERIGLTPKGRAALAEPGENDLEGDGEIDLEAAANEMELGSGEETSDTALLDELEDELSELEEQHDQEALGGRTVAPKNSERAARQAPRTGNKSAVRPKHGRSRGSMPAQRAAQREGRASLADGAAPVIGDGGI
jgi:hypothetical protein